jgi:hypothetical protein
MKRFFAVAIFAISLGAAQIENGRLPAAEEAALDRITTDALRADLTYLASDALAGRNTPSPGLELAADYIAAHFRHGGLEPAGPDGSYFQVARFARVTPDKEGFRLDLKSGEKEISVAADRVRFRSDAAADYADAPVLKLPGSGAIPAVAGRIVAADEQRYSRGGLDDLRARQPALIVLVGRTRDLRPEDPYLEEVDASRVPMLQIHDSEAQALLREDRELTLSLHSSAPLREEFPLRNVAAILRGSDPAMRGQVVALTAHYDHIGNSARGIFHGANDNASGTASVIEIAGALAALNPHPKRSILFMTFFGEEKGLLGSYYYTHHPLVPLKSTVANVNLEQMGRTDDTSGRKVGTFVFTGPSYSNLPAIMSDAAKLEGVKTDKRQDVDEYFDRSDNYAFARQGIVAHTIAVAVEFPGYHALGDTLDKIDFANMAKVDRGVAAGIVELADEPAPPKWSDAKAAAVYREAGGK